MLVELVCVTVDCRDPERLGRFWSDALGWLGIEVTDGGQRATCCPPDGGPYLEFVRVPEPKRVKNRLHLGLHAGSLAELAIEIDRLLDAGASVAWEERFPSEIGARYRNVVLRDPEGNEFCMAGGTAPE